MRRALCAAAKQLGDPQIELFLYLAHESGHRGKSVRHLRWKDINRERQRIFWSDDKEERQHTTPLLPMHVEVIKRLRREGQQIGDGWVFPSLRGRRGPVSRETTLEWWDRLERQANIPHVRGRGWHSLRRKFTDEYDELPPSQLMALGGWRSYKTIVEIYQKPREEKLRAALSRRSTARSAAATTTTNDNQPAEEEAGALPEVEAIA